MIAFSLAGRAVGCAFVDGARPLLAIRRIRRRGNGLSGVTAWVERLVRRATPVVAVLVVDAERASRFPTYREGVSAIRDALARQPAATVEVAREDIAVTLGLVDSHDGAISRAVLLRTMSLREYATPGTSFPGGSERRWGAALVAAGAAMTALKLLATDVLIDPSP